jgi:tape measure domain-containing protein
VASHDMQRLVVALEARTAAFEKALNRANGVVNQRAKAIEGRFAKMNSVIGSRMAGIGKGWIAGIVAGLGGRELAQLSDAATKIDNALKIAGLSGAELEKVYGRLRDSAVKNAAPVESLVELYSRMVLVQKDLGKSSEEIVGFTDKVAVALRVGGRSSAESAGALLQLSQAMGEGIVRAQEFNSIIEGAPALLQAAAAGIKEADGSVGKLRKIMLDGELSSRAFFDGVIAGSSTIEEKVANAEYTITQSMGNLRTGLIDAAWEFNNSTDASKRFAGGINNVAAAITAFDVSGFIKKIQDAGGALERFMNDAGNAGFFERIAEGLTGLELEVGKPIDLDTALARKAIEHVEKDIANLQANIEERTKLDLDTTDAQQQLDVLLRKKASLQGAATSPEGAREAINRMVPFNPLGPLPVAAAKPISIKDPQYRVSGDKDGKKTRRNEWERETSQIKERTAALQAETAAMAGLNPLIDDYGFALEKARAVAELENAALAAKVKITPDVKASIESLATSYAQATVDAERLAESQDLIRERAQDMADLGKDVFGGFISDLRSGTSAAEALNNALSRIADTMINNVLDAMFQVGGAGGGGGILGSIVSGLFGGGGGFSAAAFAGIGQGLYDKGGYTGAGGKKQPAGIVHKGEVVFSQDDVRRHGGVGSVEAMRLRGYSAGGPVGVPSIPSPSRRAANDNNAGIADVRVWVDRDGNWQAAVERISRGEATKVTRQGIAANNNQQERRRMTAG